MRPEAPKHLGAAGRSFWQRILADFDLSDSAQYALLEAACECQDRMAAARDAIQEDGEIVPDRYGSPKVHQACDLERRARAQFLQVMRQLGFDGGRGGDRRYSGNKQQTHGVVRRKKAEPPVRPKEQIDPRIAVAKANKTQVATVD